MIVVVPDVNPVQTLLQQDCFVAWDLQELWDDYVQKAVGLVGAQYPDLCLTKYSCLRSSDAWLDDGIIGQFIQYLECGMPLAATSSVTEWIPDPPLFKQKNSIDFGELLILDPQTAFKINADHESGQWEPVLRIISAKYTFANVKRILIPINVANSDLGYCIAGSGNGVHFILTEVNLVNDAVFIYDWLGNHPNSHYAAITGNVPSACHVWHVECTDNVPCVPTTEPLLAMLPILHSRCKDMVTSKTSASVTLHTRDLQLNGTDCGLWTLSALYARAVRFGGVPSDPARLFDTKTFPVQNPKTAMHLR